jgi:hypothetical protein
MGMASFMAQVLEAHPHNQVAPSRRILTTANPITAD